MRIYTRTGDGGETGLLFGGRVSKSDPRCEAYGSIDEAISAMGLARALCKEPRVKEVLLQVQREMFTVGSELATSPSRYARAEAESLVVTSDMVARLEGLIDEIAANACIANVFVVPGGSAGSGALDLARSLVRTGERRVVALFESDEQGNPEVLRYLNRASDLLFVLARFEDRERPSELVVRDRS